MYHPASTQDDKNMQRFDFGDGPAAEGSMAVTADGWFDQEKGYGLHPCEGVTAFQRKGHDKLDADGCAATVPMYFSAVLPEGNYLIHLTLGGSPEASDITVKAEMRRLMLEHVKTAPFETVEKTIAVNIRTTKIDEERSVKLKQRERDNEMDLWDDKLTLEINGVNPAVCAIAIEPAPEIPTVFILGDSTVCDQPGEPWNSWGQMLTRFMKPDVAVANYANSGESIRSSLGARRFAKVYSLMRPGDYAMVQFGHNDMKSKDPNKVAIYKSDLEDFVAKTRELGGTPILVTSMERKSGVRAPTLQEYPDTVRAVAAEKDVTLIDLNKMSLVFYKALGADLDRAFQDGTHHNNYGSYELASCIADGIMKSGLDLAKCLPDGFTGFDPASPDSADDFVMPASVKTLAEKPLGD